MEEANEEDANSEADTEILGVLDNADDFDDEEEEEEEDDKKEDAPPKMKKTKSTLKLMKQDLQLARQVNAVYNHR